jgi:hypothetical protein
MFHCGSVLENIQKSRLPKNVPVHFSKLPQQQPQIPAKSVVDGHAKPRAKQRTQELSQP